MLLSLLPILMAIAEGFLHIILLLVKPGDGCDESGDDSIECTQKILRPKIHK
ncbi:hypothetical protein [Candidatus Nitrosocosmicus sp. FF01]|uniref:hypothetical protein n=1 Tax=Candidatus Nitrosocosmicus sp. FF01 TaxID=3397670 RepID=UPI0039EB7E7B